MRQKSEAALLAQGLGRVLNRGKVCEVAEVAERRLLLKRLGG